MMVRSQSKTMDHLGGLNHMLRSTRLFVLAAITCSYLLVLPASAQQATPEALAGLDAYVEAGMKEWQLPGLAIAVVKDGKVVYSRGFGVRETGKSEPVTERTLFAMASNSKAFTATALGMLVDEKRLRWDDKVCDKLPEFQLADAAATRALTVRDLLCHRVGLGTWQGDLIWYGSDRSIPEVLERVKFLKPDYEFRDRYAYCNLTFLAAGELLKRVSGDSWNTFVERRLFGPIGMNRSSTSIRALEGQEDVARPHTLVDGKVAAIPYRNLDNCGPAGGINSCVRDWARWMMMQLDDGEIEGSRVVPASVIRETHAPQNLVRPTSPVQRELFPSSHFFAYGLGWFMQDYLGRMVLSHGGGMDGMLSLTVLVPEEKLGVVVLSNYDEQQFYRALPFRVVDAFLKAEPRRDWSAELMKRHRDNEAKEKEAEAKKTAETSTTPRPPLELSRYCGTYRSPALGVATVALKDGKLHIEVERNTALRGELKPKDGDLFEAHWSDVFFKTSPVPFRLDAAGSPVELRFAVRPDFVDPEIYVFTRAR